MTYHAYTRDWCVCIISCARMWVAHEIRCAHVIATCIIRLHVDVIGVRMMGVLTYVIGVFIIWCAYAWDWCLFRAVHTSMTCVTRYKNTWVHYLCCIRCSHVWCAVCMSVADMFNMLYTCMRLVCACNTCVLFIVSYLMSYKKAPCHLFSWELGPGIHGKYYHFFTYNIE